VEAAEDSLHFEEEVDRERRPPPHYKDKTVLTEPRASVSKMKAA
jgi:hypothetical protein